MRYRPSLRGARLPRLRYDAFIMLHPAPLSAHQRFVARTRDRKRQRARRRRHAIAVVAIVLGLSSCVSHLPVAQSGDAPAPLLANADARAATTPQLFDASATARGPQFLAGRDSRDRTRATLCLASAIYYEAATEPDEGQRAVAQVVLNRVRHPAWPHTVCGVVYQGSDRPGCQFSFACDGAMARAPMFSAWLRAFKAAEAALNGSEFAPIGSSTFYHTTQVSPPWRFRMIATGIVGAHIFYRQPGDGETADTLPMHYAGSEPTPGPLPRVAAPGDLMRLTLANLKMSALPQNPVVPAAPGASAYSAFPAAAAPTRVATAKPIDNSYIPGALPDSDIRPEFRDSGQWIEK